MPTNAYTPERDILFVDKFYEKANLLGYLIIAAAVAAGGLSAGLVISRLTDSPCVRFCPIVAV